MSDLNDELSRKQYVSANQTTVRDMLDHEMEWGPTVVVSTAAFHARIRGSVPGRGGLKQAKMLIPHPVANFVLWGASVTER